MTTYKITANYGRVNEVSSFDDYNKAKAVFNNANKAMRANLCRGFLRMYQDETLIAEVYTGGQ